MFHISKYQADFKVWNKDFALPVGTQDTRAFEVWMQSLCPHIPAATQPSQWVSPTSPLSSHLRCTCTHLFSWPMKGLERRKSKKQMIIALQGLHFGSSHGRHSGAIKCGGNVSQWNKWVSYTVHRKKKRNTPKTCMWVDCHVLCAACMREVQGRDDFSRV